MLADINVKIFADGADLDGILGLADDARISGFTTNPTLMWKAGLTDYGSFAQRLLERITKHPISFEVLADSAEEVLRQARLIASWGDNVYVKIPVTITTGETMARAVDILVDAPRSELIWASPREILNVVQADQIGCHIITMTNDLLAKLDLLGKDLDQFSLETVQMFRRDALAADFSL